MNTEEARLALKTLDERLECVVLECVYAINEHERIKEKAKQGKFDEDDVEYYRIRARFAMDVLEKLGYEVDYYFCNNVILKVVE